MTANQIAYQNLKETRRANLAKEAENYRSNKAKEVETYRSNVAKETETHRTNVANEFLYDDKNYASLIRALNNPFSLISHAAGGDGDAVKGLQNIIESIPSFGEFGSLVSQFLSKTLGIDDLANSAFGTATKEVIQGVKDAVSNAVNNFVSDTKSFFNDVFTPLQQENNRIVEVLDGVFSPQSNEPVRPVKTFGQNTGAYDWAPTDNRRQSNQISQEGGFYYG